MSIAIVLLSLVAGYAVVGALVAVPFVVKGAGRLDEAARGGSLGFRFLIFPGAVALWPVIGWKWLRGIQPEREPASQSPLLRWHRMAWLLVPMVALVGLALALASRPRLILPAESPQAELLPAPPDRRLP